MTVILGQTFTGISIGAVLLLIALGLSLTFGQMNVINMAHGEFIMAGAYTTYVLQQHLAGAGLSLLLALPVAFLVAGVLGVALEHLLIRRLYLRPLDTLLVTWGVSLMLQQLARDLFGAPNVQTRAPDWLTGHLTLPLGGAELSLPTSRLFILALALAAVGTLALVLRRTAL
ncbi:ABC transporter permease subunit, partial [Streptomyces albidoflavus]